MRWAGLTLAAVVSCSRTVHLPASGSEGVLDGPYAVEDATAGSDVSADVTVDVTGDRTTAWEPLPDACAPPDVANDLPSACNGLDACACEIALCQRVTYGCSCPSDFCDECGTGCDIDCGCGGGPYLGCAPPGCTAVLNCRPGCEQVTQGGCLDCVPGCA